METNLTTSLEFSNSSAGDRHAKRISAIQEHLDTLAEKMTEYIKGNDDKQTKQLQKQIDTAKAALDSMVSAQQSCLQATSFLQKSRQSEGQARPPQEGRSTSPTLARQLVSGGMSGVVAEETENQLGTSVVRQVDSFTAIRIPSGLPTFRGRSNMGIVDPQEFMEQFVIVCQAHNIDVARYTKILALCLDSVDRRWLENYVATTTMTTTTTEESMDSSVNWTALERAFLAHFQHPNAMIFWQEEIMRLRMGSEGVQRYSDQFIKLASRLAWSLTDENTIYHYKRGLVPWMLDQLTAVEANHLLTQEMTSSQVGNNVNKAMSVDMLMKMALRIEANRSIQHSRHMDGIGTGTSASSMVASSSNNRNRLSPDNSTTSAGGKCYYCGKFGHKLMECKKKRFDEESRRSDRRSLPDSNSSMKRAKDVTCWRCNKTGHYPHECKETVASTKTPVSKSVEVVEKQPHITADTAGVTGQQTDTAATAAVATMMVNEECIHTPCYLDGVSVMGLVDSGASRSFISQQWVNQHKLTVTPAVGVIKQFASNSSIPRIGRVEGLHLECGRRDLLVDLEVVSMDDEDLVIGIDLFRPLGFELMAVPFTWPSKDKERGAEKKKNEDASATGAKLRSDRPAGVSEDGIAEEWRQVLADNAALPAHSRCKLEGVALDIDTGDADPVWIRQYPIPEGYQSAVDEQIKTWLAAGTITPAPSNNQWNLALLAVRKPGKDGAADGVRVCLDARPLNALIRKTPDNHLPGLRELLDNVGTFEWITVLDLAEGYLQFPLRETDQPKTAFTWNGRQYMFTGVPFGLKIMTAHMQRIMERLLHRFGRFPYQDDVAIATKSGGNHTADVLEILKCLTYEAGLRLRISKCKFYQTSARVLGSILTQDGIKMDPAKVKAIVNWPKPVDGKGVQRFLGAAGFHRDFTPEYARISAPLEECRNLSVITWTPQRDTAFEAVKKIFMDDLTLRHIDWDKKVYLTTDASLTGIGAWIGQKNESGQLLPVVCASKKLSATQQRWSATKRELYALMWGMNKFRFYLLGRHFVAFVDHKPLVAMMGNRLSIMMEGWLDDILRFDFSTVYLPGEDNVFADALSRAHETEALLANAARIITKLDEDENVMMRITRTPKKMTP